jgi:uncharacterized protein
MAVVAVGAGVALAGWNNLVHLPDAMGRWPYVPVNLAFAGGLVAAGRWAGLGWSELGFDRRRAPRSALVGLGVVGVVATGLAIGLAVPELRSLLVDGRFADRSGADIAFHAGVRVPFGTAALEEVAFRGVFLAALTSLVGLRRAVLVSSVVFGLWHVRPGLGMLSANALLDGALAPVGLIAVVVGTAVAGAGFCLLRTRTGSLAAPFVAHAGMNAAGTLAAHLAHRLTP